MKYKKHSEAKKMPSFISFIPTPPSHINGFFTLVEVSPSDVVYDLGCGDGRLLFAALEKGAGRAVGVEIDPEPLVTARNWAKKKGFADRVTFKEADIMSVNLSDATIVFTYLCSAAAMMLKDKFENELKPGTKVVMEMFPVPGWKPKDVIERGTDFYLYIMPPEHLLE
jgi:ubiquinone/menaquinone biosynthesis C-methylase UbiE